MSEQTSNAETLPQHVGMVEAVLGVPLIPEGIGDIQITTDTIRGFAYSAVLNAVQKQLALPAFAETMKLDSDTIAHLRTPGMQRLAAEVQAANDTLANWLHPPPMPTDTDAPDTPRGRFQARSMRAHVEHAQHAPHTLINAQTGNPYKEGLLTQAPPGAGKTLLQALNLNFAGVGLPISEADPRTRTGVGILNSKLLIRQGLDPSETLHRLSNIGGRLMRIGAFFTDRRDGHAEYDVILTTPESYPVAVRKGAINPATTVRYLMDEAHRVALAPSMQQHLTHFGSGLYMYTATPAIEGGRRDLRRQFPYSQFGSLREFVEDGILSPVQLFTYRAGPETGSAAQQAVSLAIDYVESGRKTLVVCQPGGKLKQAREIADQLNALYQNKRITLHDRFKRDKSREEKIACAVGTYPGSDTAADIERLRRGERLIVTTVATGNEGLNIIDLDALIIIGPQGATWIVDQWLGRILRPSGRLAIASEIFPHDLREGKPLASIFGSFGMHHETIVPGYYIGYRDPEEQPEPLPQPSPPSRAKKMDNTASPDEESFDELSGHSQQSGAPLMDSKVDDTPPHDTNMPGENNLPQLLPEGGYLPPEDLLPALVRGISVREATIAPKDLAKMPPPEYQPLTSLTPEGVPVEWLHNIMDKQTDPAIRYVGVWEPDEETGEMCYLRYYSPAAHEYFEANPVPELASNTEFIDEQIAAILHVSRKWVRNNLKRLSIQPLDRITKQHRSPRYYGIDALTALAQELAAIPLADETDVTVGDLEHSTGSDFVRNYFKREVNDITPADKRRHPTWGMAGIALHVTGEEARTIREAYKALDVADKDRFMSLSDIATKANVTLATVLNKLKALPADMQPPTTLLRSAPKVRASDHVSKVWGEAFAEYIKPEKVLPWEATLAMIAAYFGRSKLSMYQILARRPAIPPAEVLPLPGVSEASIYPLSLIIKLGTTYGVKPPADAPRIDPSLAALFPRDVDKPNHITYSQRLQQRFLPPEQLPDPEEVGYYLNRRQTPPTLPSPQIIAEPAPDTTEPATPRSALYDLATARFKTGCTPQAFAVLVQRAELNPQDTVTEEEVVYLHETGMKRLLQMTNQIGAPPEGWRILAEVAASQEVEADGIMDALAFIESKRDYPIGQDEVALGRSGSTIELYFDIRIRRKIRGALA